METLLEKLILIRDYYAKPDITKHREAVIEGIKNIDSVVITTSVLETSLKKIIGDQVDTETVCIDNQDLQNSRICDVTKPPKPLVIDNQIMKELLTAIISELEAKEDTINSLHKKFTEIQDILNGYEKSD